LEAGGSEITRLPDVHKGLLTNASWNYEGSLLATCCKDKFLRIFDPRGNQLVSEVMNHDSPKSSRVQWMGQKNVIVTAGFTKTSERELAVYDPRNTSSRVSTVRLSASSSSMLLFADEDSSLLFVAGKGDSTISYFDVTNEPIGVHTLTEYKSNTPQNGLTLLPKSVCNVKNCEIARFLKLSGSRAEPIRFEVPRQQSHFFQDDLYPDTWDRKASISASQWASGNNGSRNLVSVKPADF
jgi:coronin-1B/1C/6